MEKEKGLYSKNTIGILLFKIVLPRYKLDYFYERITQECKMFCIFNYAWRKKKGYTARIQ